MSAAYRSLTEKEKEPLRLILHGHDAKSMASALGLSVHTVNERLRNARRKLGVTSSKEAARLLLEEEGDAPQFTGHKNLGEAPAMQGEAEHGPSRVRIGRAWTTGVILMLAAIAILALATALPSQTDRTDVAIPAHGTGSVAEQSLSSELDHAEEAALQWLGLVDREEAVSDDAAAEDAPPRNSTAAGWEKLLERQSEFGRAVEREVQRIDIVSGSSQDRWIVRFRTDFENFKGAYEKVTLVEQEGTFIAVDYEFE